MCVYFYRTPLTIDKMVCYLLLCFVQQKKNNFTGYSFISFICVQYRYCLCVFELTVFEHL